MKNAPLSSVKAYVAAVSLPGMTKRQRILNAFLWRPARVAFLAAALPALNRRLAPGITVIVPIRDRTDERVERLLKSLEDQSLDRSLVRVCIVDYGSSPVHREKITQIGKRRGCTVIGVDGKTEWNRSDAINQGLKNIRTRYLLVSDADLIFEKNYLAEALGVLEGSPRTVAVSMMLDLPEATPRLQQPYHRSIIAASLLPLLWIGGYDPAYRLWGREDDDLFFRLIAFGLRAKNISGKARYYHQYHPKFEGMPQDGSFDDAKKRNEERFSQLRRWFRRGRDSG